MRCAALVGAVMVAALMAPLGAQAAPPDAQAYHKAYEYALRCFAANAAAINRPDLTNGRSAASLDATGKLAFDAALKLGRLQGYDNARLNRDIDQYGHAEVAQMAKNDAYLRQALADCAKLGFN